MHDQKKDIEKTIKRITDTLAKISDGARTEVKGGLEQHTKDYKDTLAHQKSTNRPPGIATKTFGKVEICDSRTSKPPKEDWSGRPGVTPGRPEIGRIRPPSEDPVEGGQRPGTKPPKEDWSGRPEIGRIRPPSEDPVEGGQRPGTKPPKEDWSGRPEIGRVRPPSEDPVEGGQRPGLQPPKDGFTRPEIGRIRPPSEDPVEGGQRPGTKPPKEDWSGRPEIGRIRPPSEDPVEGGQRPGTKPPKKDWSGRPVIGRIRPPSEDPVEGGHRPGMDIKPPKPGFEKPDYDLGKGPVEGGQRPGHKQSGNPKYQQEMSHFDSRMANLDKNSNQRLEQARTVLQIAEEAFKKYHVHTNTKDKMLDLAKAETSFGRAAEEFTRMKYYVEAKRPELTKAADLARSQHDDKRIKEIHQTFQKSELDTKMADDAVKSMQQLLIQIGVLRAGMRVVTPQGARQPGRTRR
ncbi:MAG: hypothetical protein HY711_00505 [Candidatus Melainabacteria bacterium]|nr:hypothetical protein [Candidatus Melainabacteria bacterium]